MLGAVVREKINETADLRRQMMTMRINCVHRKFHRPVFGQQTNQTARLEIVGNKKSRRQKNTDALQGSVRSVSPLLEIRLPEIRTDAVAPFPGPFGRTPR